MNHQNVTHTWGKNSNVTEKYYKYLVGNRKRVRDKKKTKNKVNKILLALSARIAIRCKDIYMVSDPNDVSHHKRKCLCIDWRRLTFTKVHNRTLKHNKVGGMHMVLFPKHRLTFDERSVAPAPITFVTPPPLLPPLGVAGDGVVALGVRAVNGNIGPLAASSMDDAVELEIFDVVVSWYDGGGSADGISSASMFNIKEEKTNTHT